MYEDRDLKQQRKREKSCGDRKNTGKVENSSGRGG